MLQLILNETVYIKYFKFIVFKVCESQNFSEVVIQSYLGQHKTIFSPLNNNNQEGFWVSN